jgi:hypothetical protein
LLPGIQHWIIPLAGIDGKTIAFDKAAIPKFAVHKKWETGL